MTLIVEDHLHFEFDSSWDRVEKWDDSEAHKTGVGRVQGIDALDIVAFSRRRNECLLLEIKDYRAQNEAAGRATGRKPSKTLSAPSPSTETEDQVADKLTEMVASKLAGTIVGLVGAARMQDQPFANDLATALAAHRREGVTVRVVLWVEGEPTSKGRSPRSKVNLGTLMGKLKRKVAWMTSHPIQVLSTASPAHTIPGLTVTDTRP